MKKNLLLLLAFVCCITVFTSCDDKKEETTPPAVAGTWKLPAVVFGENADKEIVITSTPVHMIWEGNIAAGEEGAPMLGGIFDLPAIVYMAQGMGAEVLGQVLGEVKLHNNGDISAMYSTGSIIFPPDPENPPTPTWVNSGTGYATYKEISATKILVFLNLKKIVGEDPEDAQIMEGVFTQFPILKKIITEGIPVNYALSSDKNSCRLYVDKQFVDQFMPLIPIIVEMLPTDSEDPMIGLARTILGDIPRVMNETKTFELGLNLIK